LLLRAAGRRAARSGPCGAAEGTRKGHLLGR